MAHEPIIAINFNPLKLMKKLITLLVVCGSVSLCSAQTAPAPAPAPSMPHPINPGNSGNGPAKKGLKPYTVPGKGPFGTTSNGIPNHRGLTNNFPNGGGNNPRNRGFTNNVPGGPFTNQPPRVNPNPPDPVAPNPINPLQPVKPVNPPIKPVNPPINPVNPPVKPVNPPVNPPTR